MKLHFISEARLEELVERERRSAYLAGAKKAREILTKQMIEGGYLRMSRKGLYFLPEEFVNKLSRGEKLPHQTEPKALPNEFTCVHGHTFRPGDTSDCYEHIYGKKMVMK